MIPHNMTLFKFICVQYQFHRQTLPIMKIDRGQIQFRDYVSTGTEPKVIPICRYASQATHSREDAGGLSREYVLRIPSVS